MAAPEEAFSASLPDHRELVDLADRSFPRCWRRRCLPIEWQDWVRTVWRNSVRMGRNGWRYDLRNGLIGVLGHPDKVEPIINAGDDMVGNLAHGLVQLLTR